MPYIEPFDTEISIITKKYLNAGYTIGFYTISQ